MRGSMRTAAARLPRSPIDADAEAVVIPEGEAEIDAALVVDALHLVGPGKAAREGLHIRGGKRGGIERGEQRP